MKHWGIGVMISGLLLLCTSGSAVAAAVMITDLQYWLAPNHIQTVLALNTTASPGYHHRSNPARFVLEIPDCDYLWGSQTIAVNDLLLQRIRIQRLGNGTTQVVFDLAQKAEADVQILPPANGQPDRIIVTLFDAGQQTTNQPQVSPMPVPTQTAETLKKAAPAPLPEVPVQRAALANPVPNVPVQKAALPRPSTQIVVLDPGHGGQDPGAIGANGLREKDVVLEMARSIRTLLERNAPHVKVVLTRDDDSFLSLPKRTEIAEEAQADLFVSLHVNANPSRKVNGFSVYTLSENATDAAARELAEKENAVDLLFGGIETPKPTNDALLAFVLADLSKTAWLQHSLEFGRLSVDTTVAALRKYKIEKEGLKRANFAVLRTAAMPAVLVEACYISNEKEEGLLTRQDFQMKLAQSLAKSIMDYFAQWQNSGKPQVIQASADKSAMALLSQGESQTRSPNKVHVVKSGESLSVIAGKYGVDLIELYQLNNLVSADTLQVGQKLWIP